MLSTRTRWSAAPAVAALALAPLACSPSPSRTEAANAAVEAADIATSPLGATTVNDAATPADESTDEATDEPTDEPTAPAATPAFELATFGAGCFWCVEAVLEQLDGVIDVSSGYTGGKVDDPTYQQVCSGTTGHAEVVQVTFDPKKLRYETLLEWFFKLHDPTTLDRQGADTGTQYRSAIFYHSEAQRVAAVAAKQALDAADAFDAPIVTEITPASTFWEAEDDHQDFYRQNRSSPYCRAVITPKLDKLGLEP